MTGSEKSKLLPTDVGTVVNDFLMEYFPAIMDYNFTANVEKEFDEVAEGEKPWTGLMEQFYQKFHPLVEQTLSVKSEHKVGERVWVLTLHPVNRFRLRLAVSDRWHRLVRPKMRRSRVLPS